MNALENLQPFGRADRRAADLQHVLAGELGDVARLGNAREHLGDAQLLSDFRVKRVVQAVRPDAGDAAAGAEHMDLRLRHGSSTTLPKKSRESTTRWPSAAWASGSERWITGLSLPSA